MADWGPFDLGGKAAIVTGGAQGIGFGIVSQLAAAGADVVIADLDENAGKEAVERLGEIRGRAVAVAADVSDVATGKALAESCVREFGSVDILVNNVGIYPWTGLFVDAPERPFDQMAAVNVRGTFFTSQGVAQRMIELGSPGAIVNIASLDGLSPSFPGLVAYGTSKGGVLQMTRGMALELAEHGIRVNSISPGTIKVRSEDRPESGGIEDADDAAELERLLEGYLDRVPLKQLDEGFGRPADIGMAAVYLASPASTFVTGHNMIVDGGYTLS